MVPRLREKCPRAVRGGQDAGVTQPTDHSLAEPCIVCICPWINPFLGQLGRPRVIHNLTLRQEIYFPVDKYGKKRHVFQHYETLLCVKALAGFLVDLLTFSQTPPESRKG